MLESDLIPARKSYLSAYGDKPWDDNSGCGERSALSEATLIFSFASDELLYEDQLGITGIKVQDRTGCKEL